MDYFAPGDRDAPIGPTTLFCSWTYATGLLDMSCIEPQNLTVLYFLYLFALFLNTLLVIVIIMSEITKIKITKKVIKDESKRIPCNN
jgi:hypothetical protein